MELVKTIKAELENSTGARCWMDLVNIESGHRKFTQAIIDGIESSKVFLFLRSNHSQNSEFAMLELHYAFEECPNLHVVIVHIDNSPMNKELRFFFKFADSIEWNNQPQHEKLIKDIINWVDKHKVNTSDFPKQKREEDTHQRAAENASIQKSEKDAYQLLKEGINFYSQKNMIWLQSIIVRLRS